MRFLYLLFSLYFGLLACLPPNADAHELTESLALRDHHEQDHHDSELLEFLLDHYAGQTHRHEGEGKGSAQDHQSLPFHHAHDCSHVFVAWVTPVLVPVAPGYFHPLAAQLPAYTASAPAGITNPCWQPPRA